MRFLREALLSMLVIGLVLYLYVVAAGAVLCSMCGFVSHRQKPAAIHHSKLAAGTDSMSHSGPGFLAIVR
jgi:hypothetical protein